MGGFNFSIGPFIGHVLVAYISSLAFVYVRIMALFPIAFDLACFIEVGSVTNDQSFCL